MTKYYLLILFIFTISISNAQLFEGSTTLSSTNNMTLDVSINTNTNEVTIEYTGPSNLWYAVGFGGSSMANTYIILTDGAGNVTERKLGNHNAGSQLSPSLTSSNTNINGSIRTTTVTRPLMGPNGDYYDFSGASTIPLIWARGTGANLAYHGSSNKGPAMVTMTSSCNIPVTNLGDTTVCPGEMVNVFGQMESMAGLYFDTLSGGNGCDSVLSFELINEMVNTDINVFNGDSIVASATNASFQWIDCTNDSILTGDTLQYFVAQDTGSYAVIVTQNGCSDTSVCSNSITSVEDLSSNEFVNLYPNPVHNILSIESDEAIKHAVIIITDIQGKILYTKEFSQLKREKLDLSNLPEGFYILKLRGEEFELSKSFFKDY